jgi:predicted RNA-binding protein associated with RNAse of E/G family
MNIVTVQKCAPDGAPVLSYQAELAERWGHGARLLARWERPALDLGYTTFEAGDRFTEWFYSDRWYNVLEIRSAADGALKGWYCNITAPATIGQDAVVYRDLYLDVWVAPDGSTLVLDEDEFDAAPLHPQTRRRAQDGLRALLAEIERCRAPFDALRSR